MTDRPILFSAPMIRAILREVSAPGTGKTQTRRVLKPRPRRTIFFDAKTAGLEQFREPAYRAGDRLWVREAISYDRLDVDRDGILPPWYWADGNPDAGDWTRPKPSIHMPRWASRLTLHVTDVRVQRLQEISEADAMAEGAKRSGHPIDGDMVNHDGGPVLYQTAVRSFNVLWNSINGPAAWGANPWVAAYTFTVQRGNIDKLEIANA